MSDLGEKIMAGFMVMVLVGVTVMVIACVSWDRKMAERKLDILEKNPCCQCACGRTD